MRKRTVNCIVKNIFWYTIYLLPIIVALILTLSVTSESFFPWFSEEAIHPHVDGLYLVFINNLERLVRDVIDTDFNPIYLALVSAFGTDGGVFPLFFNESSWGVTFIAYFAYFVSVYLLHILIDFLLFIPRLCHKWMNSFTATEDES